MVLTDSRILDQNFFGSEVIETAVLPPSDMRIKDEEGADLKYQSIPIYDEDNVQGKAASLVGDDHEEEDDEEGDMEDGEGSTQTSEHPVETERNQDKSDQPKSMSVNYGYHPIIDFFDRYRFDAA